jgi:hypothetical protein
MKQTTIIIAAASLLLISCGSGTEGTPVEKTGTTVNKEEKKQGLNFKVDEDVKLGDFMVKVNKVEEFKSNDEFMQPEKDMKLIAIEVEYSNPTTDKQINSNPFDWSASDNEGYSYEYDPMMAKEPMLDGKTLNPGGKVKGWLTFKIPKANQLTKAQFKPGIMVMDNANVEFTLQ